MTHPLAELDRVTVLRGGREILREISLTVQPGSITAITGPSGSGKSTLLSVLAGLLAPTTGDVRFAGGRRLGLVLQNYGLVALLTAAENVEVAVRARDELSRDDVLTRAAAALDGFGLASVADHLVEELSGGQQQRVALARAVAVRPNLLLADEFSSALDPVNRDRAERALVALARTGTAVVLATHDTLLTRSSDTVVDLTSAS